MIESTKTAIITAVLTGIFTVVAGVVTYWFTTKEPELSYSVVGGPTLSGALGAKRIFVVEVQNAGGKEVAQTLVQVSLKSGELSEAASEASPGVKLAEEKTSNQIDIRADLLNPGDSVKVSFLASLVSPNSEPRVVVRAPGVKAVSENSKSEGRSELIKLLPLIAGALTGVLGVYLMAARIGVFGRIVSRVPSTGGTSSLDQSEVCAYLCAACGLHEEADRLRFGGTEMSYRGAADFLVQRAQQVDASQRAKYEATLRAFLLFSAATENSQRSIRASLDLITATPMTDEQFEEIKRTAIKEGADPVIWRQKVAAFVRELDRSAMPLAA